MSIFVEYRGIILESNDKYELDNNAKEFLDMLIDIDNI